MIEIDTIHNMDCLDAMKQMTAQSVNLIVTSPPYADQRKATYGGTHPDQYVQWFLPIADELFRILADDGSFILNIKEKVVDGQRHTYVMELIIALKQRGWLFTEEYIWHKKNAVPGKWPNRFRDAWERCIHFTKNKKFKMNQESVMIPMGDWAEPRLKKLSENDQKRISSATKSGFGKTLERWVGKDMVYPTNVLHLSTESGNKNHSAVFPVALPEWFIKLFSDEGDVVFDPFLGSGTTALAAKNLNRHYIGTEIQPEYFRVAQQRIGIQLMDDDTRNFFDGLVDDDGYVADESSRDDLGEKIVENEPFFRFDDNQN